MGARRLPGKVLRDILGKPMLFRMVERVRRARRVGEVVIATTVSPGDDAIAEMARSEGISFFRGSEEDVLDRVLQAARTSGADVIVELGGDAPLVDPRLIDEMIAYYLGNGFDYVANTAMRHSAAWKKESTFPVGTSAEIFSTELLGKVAEWTRDPTDREHVSSYIFERPDRFRLGAFEAVGKWASCRRSDIRLTVDTPQDLDLVREVFGRLYPPKPEFTLEDVVRLLVDQPRLLKINEQVVQTRAFEQRQQQTV